jgi:hypothetical protein
VTTRLILQLPGHTSRHMVTTAGVILRPGRAGSRRRHVRIVVVLTGRATRVPQAAVAGGMQRSATVTRRGPMAWAQRSDLGWGRKPKLHGMQGVKALCRPCPARPADLPVTEDWRTEGVREQTGPDLGVELASGPRLLKNDGRRTGANTGSRSTTAACYRRRWCSSAQIPLSW